MKNKGAVVVVAAMMLLLGGCAGTVQPGPTVTVPTQAEAPVETPNAAAITQAAEAPATDTARVDPAKADADLVAGLDYFWQGEKPTPEQWIAAGHLVCERLSQGTGYSDVRVVEGDSADAEHNNSKVVLYATQFYCPQFTLE